MRKFILIAGFVLASAAAQAGDRSLSLGGGETTRVSAPAKATEGSRTAEVPQAAEAPKYVERPAAVEPKAERSSLRRPGPRRSDPRRAGPRRATPRGPGPRRPACSGTPIGPRAPDPEDPRPRPRSCDDVQGRGSAPHALQHPGTYHYRAAPARHLLVIPRSTKRTASCPGLSRASTFWDVATKKDVDGRA